MATSLTVNGVSYLYPDTGDQSWGTVASAWAAAVTSGMLQKAGGAFALTADANFGINFGLLSLYFTSQSANAAASGVVRLASTEAISWRNNANSADVLLAKNSSDQLTWAGHVISSSAGVTPVSAGGTGVSSVTTSPTATSFAGWDANSNLSANAFIPGFTSTATAAGTTTMTIASTGTQIFTGSTTQTVKLPTTGIVAGASYFFVNTSSGVVTVQSSAGNTIQAMAANSWAIFTAVVSTPTTAANWNASYTLNNSGVGTVTSVTFTGDGTVLSSTPSSAVTSSGTLTASLINQAKNTILAGPVSGSNAAPTYRKGILNDLLLTSQSKTADYTILAADDLITGDSSGGTFTFTLPAANSVPVGKPVTLKKTDSSATAIAVSRASTDTIDGATSTNLSTQYETLVLMSNGSNQWFVINRNYPRTFVSYTPTFTGMGTVSSIEFQSRRVGDSLEIQGKFLCGTATATEARITLGFNGINANVTSASSTRIPSIMLVGAMVQSTTQVPLIVTLVETSVGYLTIGLQDASHGGLTKLNGNGVFGTNTYSFFARVPISGWNE